MRGYTQRTGSTGIPRKALELVNYHANFDGLLQLDHCDQFAVAEAMIRIIIISPTKGEE